MFRLKAFVDDALGMGRGREAKYAPRDGLRETPHGSVGAVVTPKLRGEGIVVDLPECEAYRERNAHHR